MTIFGKLLTFFNLLAVGAFAYFATQDRAGRQTITAAVVRHRVAVEGLPFGSGPNDPVEMPSDPDPEAGVPFPVELGGGQRTTTVSRPLLDAYFAQIPGGGVLAPGATVPTQLAEVRRVRAKVDELLKGPEAKPGDKLRYLTDWVRYQPETYDEREAVLRLINAGDVKGLEAKLAARFDAVLNPPAPDPAPAGEPLPDLAALQEELAKAKASKTDVDAKQKAYDEAAAKAHARGDRVASRAAPLGEAERRDRVAHLLAHLDRDPDWQKRVLGVVGARQYAKTLIDQANRVKEMVKRPRASVPADEADYQAARKNFQQAANAQTTLANNQAELRRKWVEQKRREDDLVAQRETQLKTILTQYDKVKAEVDDLLAKQADVEAALFAVQREVAITLDEVYRLEAVLEARERDLLLGAPPRP